MTKIIITESQYQRLIEEKRSLSKIFQDMIDKEFDNIKVGCETFDFLRLPDGISFDSCTDSALIDNIKVDDVKFASSNKLDVDGNEYNVLYLKLTINCSVKSPKTEFDGIVYDLKQLLSRNTGGVQLSIDYQVNTI